MKRLPLCERYGVIRLVQKPNRRHTKNLAKLIREAREESRREAQEFYEQLTLETDETQRSGEAVTGVHREAR